MAAKTAHSLAPGQGYVRHDFPPALRAVPLAPPCLPPGTTEDGSAHRLQPPHGGPALTFSWIKRELAWERPGGNRLAWTAAYLGAHGWTYAGVFVEEDAEPTPFVAPVKRRRKAG